MKNPPWKPARRRKKPGESCQFWCGGKKPGTVAPRSWCTKKCRDDAEKRGLPELLPRVVIAALVAAYGQLEHETNCAWNKRPLAHCTCAVAPLKTRRVRYREAVDEADVVVSLRLSIRDDGDPDWRVLETVKNRFGALHTEGVSFGSKGFER